MYAFWWHKPLDVEQPTIVSVESFPAADSVLAFLYMTTRRLPVPYRISYSEMPEAANIHCASVSHAVAQDTGSATRSTNLERTSALTAWRRRVTMLITPRVSESPPDQKVNVIDSEMFYEKRPGSRPASEGESPVKISIEDLKARQQRTFLPHNVELQPTGLSYKLGDVKLSKSDILRWVLAMALLKDEEAEARQANSSAESRDCVTDRVSDLPPLDLDPNHLDWHLLLAFNISSMLYGGLHALAWNSDFGSDSRKFLWRLSTIGVMGFFAISTLILYIERMLFHKPKAENMALKASHFVLYRLELAGIMFCAGFLTFLAARTYLLVECYITLTDLPKEAYNMPQWTRFIPHL